MCKALSIKYLSLIILITSFLVPLQAVAKSDKRFERSQCANRHEAIIDWREDKSKNEIIVFDDLHRERYRISTETGRVVCGLQSEVEELDLEVDGG